MYAEERRASILELLRHRRRVGVSLLAEQMAASQETIRRDLREMEAEGLLKRTHGGAILPDVPDERPETPIMQRKSQNFLLKDGIARKAAGFVKNGDVVAIDNSTTVFCLLRHMPRDFHLTIISNSVPVLAEIMTMQHCEWTCTSLGGVMHRHSSSTFGPLAYEALGHFRPNKLFMSCGAIDVDGRLTEGNLHDAEMKRALIACSQTTFLLADETKFGKIGVVNGPDASELDYLVTNASINRKRLEALRDKDVKIVFDTKE